MIYRGYNISKFVIALGFYFLVVILGVVDLMGIGSILKYIALIPFFSCIGNVNRIGLDKSWINVKIYYSFAILSILWTIDYELSINAIFAFASFFLLISCMPTQVYNKGEIYFLKKMLVWSSRLSLVCTWFFATFSEGRLIIREAIMKEDPNYLCAYFFFGIAFCVQNFLINEKKWRKITCIGELLLYLFTIFCTGSRGGLFGGLVVAAIVFIKATNIKSISAFISRFALVGVLFLLIPLIASLVNPDVMDRFSEEAISESDGSGRYEIWEDAIKAFGSYDFFSFVFGKGVNASRTVAFLYHFQRVNVMHNVFLENLIGLGIIGAGLYLMQLWTLYKKSQIDVFCMSVFIGTIVLSLSTSILFLKPVWNIQLMIACVCYSNMFKKC